MTGNADFKRRVRARMAKTGESYATTRGRREHRRRGVRPHRCPGGAALPRRPVLLPDRRRAGPRPRAAAGRRAGTRVRLTAAGLRVLQGDADHVAQGGVDRWIGGVHLAGPDSPWRWDEGTESIVTLPDR